MRLGLSRQKPKEELAEIWRRHDVLFDQPSAPEVVETRIYHLRQHQGYQYPIRVLRRMGVSPDPKGGWTGVRLTLSDGRVVWGQAVCSSRDNFCRATGRQIALGRALKAAGL